MTNFLTLNIGVLKFLEQLRNPLLDFFFSNLTILAEEYSTFAVVIFVYWCINKKKGNYLLIMLFMGLIVNQFLKLSFMIPRPWVFDSDFTIVDSARAMALGYSFPSGHTQSSITVYGGIGYLSNNKFVKWTCYIIAGLIAFSRMYLGVHYPIDVVVSLLVGIAFIPLFLKLYADENRKKNTLMWVISFIITIVYTIYAKNKYNNALLANFDAEEFSNYSSALEIGYKMVGGTFAAIINSLLNPKYTNFKTEAPLFKQIVKFVFGFLICLFIQKFTKAPLISLFGEFGDAIRYFMIILMFSTIWPYVFDKFINK